MLTEKQAEEKIITLIGQPYKTSYSIEKGIVTDPDTKGPITAFGKTNKERVIGVKNNFLVPSPVKKVPTKQKIKNSFYKIHIKEHGKKLEEEMQSKTDPSDMSMYSKSFTRSENNFY